MTASTGNQHRDHENSPKFGDENGEGLPAAGKRPCTTSRQAHNHMSTGGRRWHFTGVSR